MPVVLRSKRLHLRILGAGQLDAVHALFSSDGHTIGEGPISDPQTTLEWLNRRSELHEETGLAWYGVWDVNGQFEVPSFGQVEVPTLCGVDHGLSSSPPRRWRAWRMR